MLATVAHHALFAVSVAGTAPLVALSEWLPTGRGNPDFDPSRRELASEARRMRAEAKPLERPVVVLSGYKAWPIMAEALAGHLARLTSGDRGDFLSVSYTWKGRIDRAVDLSLASIEQRLPSPDEIWTREVDVVGISMGGLVARRAAMDRGGGKRLRIRRLFTLASPHGGARLADWIRPDSAARDMRTGSDFLCHLDGAWMDNPVEVYPYAVLNDTWVGARRTMPPGCGAYWTRGSVVGSHFTISANRRVVTDIALRLRGEDPLAKQASVPPVD